jgi:Tol biopolymer transport system component
MARPSPLNLALTLTVFALTSCGEDTSPTQPGTAQDPSTPEFAISDARHSGNPHFYFLPPLARAPHPTGTFDPARSPTVRICVLPACANDIVTFVSGSGSGRVRVSGAAYRVNWHTKAAGLLVGQQCRVRVFVGVQLLGFMDIQVVAKRGKPTAVASGFLPLRQDRPLLIKFRIEKGALGLQGSRIVFSTSRDGNNPEVFFMNPDGSGQTNLTNDPAGDSQPARSPDGTRLAFTSTRGGSTGFDFNIWVMNADGSGPLPLTSDPARDEGATWSPDGSKIAFVSNRDANQEIYVMNADGSGQTRLTDNPARDDQPAWSPDGSKIAFMSFRDGNAEIYVMNPDGTNPIRLTTNPLSDVTPAWSPDGSKIAFTSADVVGGFLTALDIYVMNADGSGRTRLTDDAANDLDPTWAPDGSRIAFVSERDLATGHQEIFAMNADGTDQVNLTNDPGQDFDPDWGPF